MDARLPSSSLLGSGLTGMALLLGASTTAAILLASLSKSKPETRTLEQNRSREISIFSANAYLIPWFYVYKLVLEGDQFAINSCKDQHARAKVLASIAQPRDIVALQEIWGGASDVVHRELKESHTVLPRYRYWEGMLGTGLGADYVNTLTNHLQRNGGLWFGAHMRSGLHVVWSLHHTFVHNVGEEFMNKSVSFVLLDTSARWGPDTHILLLNTHVHSPNPFDNTSDRRAQRKEMMAILASLPERLAKDLQGKTFDWTKCGAVLVGDLNSAHCSQGDRSGTQTTPEYKEIIEDLDGTDFFLENDAFDRKLIGRFTYDGSSNPYVSEASKKDSSRMDYALGLNSIKGGSVKLMPLRASRCNIMDEEDAICSDHFPLSFTVYPAV